jgi:O-antigen/teichoic acid export membrane protein
MIPYTLLQALGRPDLTARFHLIELPVYVLVLWSMIRTFGIEGAAIAWLIRVALDALLLFAMARRFLPGGAPRWTNPGRLVGILLPLPVLAALHVTVIPKYVVGLLAFVACGLACRHRLPIGGKSPVGEGVGAG